MRPDAMLVCHAGVSCWVPYLVGRVLAHEAGSPRLGSQHCVYCMWLALAYNPHTGAAEV